MVGFRSSTPLIRAVSAENESAVLVRRSPGVGSGGHRRKDACVVQALLEGGADPAFACPDGDTALHMAAQRCLLPIIRRLLAAGAPVNSIGFKLDSLTGLKAKRDGPGMALQRQHGPDASGREGERGLRPGAAGGRRGCAPEGGRPQPGARPGGPARRHRQPRPLPSPSSRHLP